MKWLKRILIALVPLLALAAALSYFISLDDYIPQIEKALSARLNEPISIKRLRLIALPQPHVSVSGITIGTGDDIKLDQVRVTPALFSLLQSVKVIKSIEIDSPSLTLKAAGRIPAWSKPDTDTPPQVRVQKLRVNSALLVFDESSFGPFNAGVSLDDQGEPVDMSMTTQDGKLKVAIKRVQAKYLIDASAKAWKLPAGLPLLFDELNIKGVATPTDAALSQVSGKLYGGTVSGNAAISWHKGFRVNGNLDIAQVEMQDLASMLSARTRVSGRLTAAPVYSAVAASAEQLPNALRLATPFTVTHGVVRGVDIRKAATGAIKRGATGGETHFDRLSGHLLMEHGSYRFTQLKIASGLLAADGNVTISPKKALSGRLNTRVSAAGISASVPLNVAGTMDAPLLYPTAGTVAGAAVGTALLGPGVGTSVGARIGDWVEDRFGKKAKTKRKNE